MEPFPAFLVEKMNFEDAGTPLWEQYSEDESWMLATDIVDAVFLKL